MRQGQRLGLQGITLQRHGYHFWWNHGGLFDARGARLARVNRAIMEKRFELFLSRDFYRLSSGSGIGK